MRTRLSLTRACALTEVVVFRTARKRPDRCRFIHSAVRIASTSAMPENALDASRAGRPRTEQSGKAKSARPTVH